MHQRPRGRPGRPGRLAGVIFDKDGVLVDFERTWTPAFRVLAGHLAARAGVSPEPFLQAIGYEAEQKRFAPNSLGGAGGFDEIAAAWSHLVPDIGRETLERLVDDHFSVVDQQPLLPPWQLQTLFGDLRGRGYELAIATNDSRRSGVNAAEAFGLTPHLAMILGYDSVANPKPAPDPVMAFCRGCGLAPEAVAVVGDNPLDMRMARAAGAGAAIGVLSGNSSADKLGPLADHLIDDVAGLPDILALYPPPQP